MNNSRGKWIFGITGASGMKYALRLLEVASTQLDEVHIIISEAGLRVLAEEEKVKVSFGRLNTLMLFGQERSNCFFYNPRDIGASVASGSFKVDGMVVVPCSTGTLAAVAHGLCENLIHRAADVTLKEGRKLIMVPRETPFSTIQIENLLSLSRAGARIVPAMPGFYHQPTTINELVDMMVMKILDQMGVHTELVKRWGQEHDSHVGSNAGSLNTGPQRLSDVQKHIAESRVVRQIGGLPRPLGAVSPLGSVSSESVSPLSVVGAEFKR